MKLTIKKHSVAILEKSRLSPLQQDLLEHKTKIRIADAPTGAGKTYAFQQGLLLKGQRILFIVPTRRLAQNIAGGVASDLMKAGYNAVDAENSVAIWSSDEGSRLQEEEGIHNIRGFRIRQMQAINPARPEQGEMIVAIPEVLSHLLLGRRLDTGHSSIGVFDVLNAFDHVVFDEFHTIEARGFGMAALFAALVPYFGRAKLSLLSATPVDVKPVLLKLGIAEEHIAELHEEIVPTGRPLHGDVQLHLKDSSDMCALITEHMDLIRQEVSEGRQIVVIYNSLRALKDHLYPLASVFKSAGIEPDQVLTINSIDDSGINGIHSCGFHVGQKRNPDDFSILLATASVEMGVTFREANVMLMESGFAPMNFLQRYGRAARRGEDGQVIVRLDEASENRHYWLRVLKKWVKENEGSEQTIHELTRIMSSTIELKNSPNSETSYFGELGTQAVYTSGLYWQTLMRHPSNSKYQREHLLKHHPASSKHIYGLIKTIQVLETNTQYAKYTEEWLKRFYGLALQYRDIGKRITLIEGSGRRLQVGRLWLERETDLLTQFPSKDDENGNSVVEISGELDDYLLENRNQAKRLLTTYFPHLAHSPEIEAGTGLVKEWCRYLNNKREMDTEFAWDDFPDAMKAVESLVQLTGLVPNEESSLSDVAMNMVL